MSWYLQMVSDTSSLSDEGGKKSSAGKFTHPAPVCLKQCATATLTKRNTSFLKAKLAVLIAGTGFVLQPVLNLRFPAPVAHDKPGANRPELPCRGDHTT